ncbi:stonustoxin subunit beta isoform X2 [Electrophorus electricus]|uniref:stonustoxin subunit beta isoform X2 n=1 Tax=Electrophorus electricus TaxID=8005 RepID=UPI000F09CB0A|nr:stonustoxin subunit beta isoform X2 [Electrophorus electricus]
MPSQTSSSSRVMPEQRKAGRKGSQAAVPADWMPVSLDDRTSQKMLWLSDSGSKVSRMKDVACPVLDRPERYEHAPQVLCKEGVFGRRGYWEVEHEGWVVIGVVYESSGRKVKDGPCGLGENAMSWAVGWGGSCYQAWHNGENVEIPGTLCNAIGVYVDQPAGIISFYLVEGGQGEPREVRLIHSFKTSLTDKLLPGFWVGQKSYCSILKKDQ